MQTLATRLSLPTAALLVASVLTVGPAAAPPAALSAQVPSAVEHSVYIPDIALTATVGDIFEFPAFRQWVLNEVVQLVILVEGVAESGSAAVQALLSVPSNLVLITRQILARDLLGALTTIETELVEAISTIGTPLVDAAVDRRQQTLAVAGAMQAAVPAALIGFGNALLAAFDTVARASIIAGQAVVDSVFPLGFGNIIGALIDGIGSVLQSLVVGGGQIVDGIVFAQQTIATALKARPAAEEEAGGLATASSLVSALPKTTRTAVTLDTTKATAIATDADTAPVADEEGTTLVDVDVDDAAAQQDSPLLTGGPDTADELTGAEPVELSDETEDASLTDNEGGSAPVTADKPDDEDASPAVNHDDDTDTDTDTAGGTDEDSSTTN